MLMSASEDCDIDNIEKLNETLEQCESPTKSLVIRDNRTDLWTTLVEQTPTVQYVQMRYLNLTAIDGLAACGWVDLLKLDVSSNAIKHLQARYFDDCSVLIELIYFNNEIEQLPPMVFDGLTSLKVLDLSSNRINILAVNVFKPLKKLEILRLGTNRIQIIDADLFSHNHNIQTLYLHDNVIEFIQPKAFWRLKQLTTLDIGNNPNLTYIDLSNMVKLRDVTVNNAALKSLVVPLDVDRIDASSNHITHVNATRNSRIQMLNVANNHILTVNDVQPMDNLIDLNLERNNIAGFNIQNTEQFLRIVKEFNSKLPKIQRIKMEDEMFYTPDQFRHTATELNKRNLSIVRKPDNNAPSFHIYFPVRIESEPKSDAGAQQADLSSYNFTDIFVRLKRLESAVQQHEDQGNIDERFASLRFLVALMIVLSVIMTAVNFACIVFCNYEYYLRIFRRIRSDRRNVSAENLNVEIEL